jgi:hypothetical protein
MSQRYLAPMRVISVQPESPRYSVVEDRRMNVAASSYGWYPDPYDRSGGLRWWDGSKWSMDLTREPQDGGHSRHLKAIAALVLLASFATVLAISLLA